MAQPTVTVHPVLRGVVLSAIVAVAAALAVLLHRTGHTQGDDFALYLRQARSLFDGDVGQVVADNRFAVLNSDGAFSPIAYPWVWPLLLSPFVHAWGLDYDRLKLVEVAIFCLWLVLLHGIVRRRIGWWPAIAIVVVFATAPAYLAHTDQLLSEFAHLAAVALAIWCHDRIRRDATLLTASTGWLFALGGSVTLAFNVRRESIVLLGVLGVMAMYDIVDETVRTRSGSSTDDSGPRALGATVRRRWRAIVTPFAAFAATAVFAQLLLPTELLPDNGNSTAFLDDRMAEYPGILSDQLGLGEHTAIGVAVLLLALVGAAIGVRRRPTLDGPLLLLAVFSTVAVSTHLRRVDRYWFQVTPWVVYFATVALVATAGWFVARRDARSAVVRLATAAALVPLAALTVGHVIVLAGDVADVREYNDAGRVQSGPSNPAVAPIFEAVESLTPPDAVVAYFRARTMTLLTDRRSFQTKDLDRIIGRADYYAERRNSTYWQPELDPAGAQRAGLEEVWSDQRWILWRVPDPTP
jgi:hypothetical protein